MNKLLFIQKELNLLSECDINQLYVKLFTEKLSKILDVSISENLVPNGFDFKFDINKPQEQNIQEFKSQCKECYGIDEPSQVKYHLRSVFSNVYLKNFNYRHKTFTLRKDPYNGVRQLFTMIDYVTNLKTRFGTKYVENIMAKYNISSYSLSFNCHIRELNTRVQLFKNGNIKCTSTSETFHKIMEMNDEVVRISKSPQLYY
jgi:hypothetical protein